MVGIPTCSFPVLFIVYNSKKSLVWADEMAQWLKHLYASLKIQVRHPEHMLKSYSSSCSPSAPQKAETGSLETPGPGSLEYRPVNHRKTVSNQVKVRPSILGHPMTSAYPLWRIHYFPSCIHMIMKESLPERGLSTVEQFLLACTKDQSSVPRTYIRQFTTALTHL